MKISEIKQAHQADKGKAQEDNEAYQAKYYARPLSYYMAWFFIKYGISPNNISLLAFIIGLIGCVALATGQYWVVLFGILLMNIRHVLDYADGTVARATGKSSKFGCYLDRIFDELIGIILPVSIGLGLYFYPHYLSQNVNLILGMAYALVTATSALSLAQVGLVYGIAPHSFYQPQKWGLWRLIYVVGTNLQSMSVILMPIFAIFSAMEIYLVFYLVLTTCEMSAAILIRMLNHEDN